MSENENYFTALNAVNVNDKTEKKNGLTYLSWAWAWGEIKKAHPDTTYTVYENADGWNYHTDGKTCWVKCGVTCNGIENIEYLPIMDFKNRSIPADSVTSMDVNKAIQRCLTKAVARHGLGLYIYAGEDLPEEDADTALVRNGAKMADNPPYNPYLDAAPAAPAAPAAYDENTRIPELGKSANEIFSEDGIDGIRAACKACRDTNQQAFTFLVTFGTRAKNKEKEMKI